MEKYFCYGKKDFCDSIDKCQFCKFFDGTGCVDGELAHSILSGIFGEDYDLDRLKEVVEADREGRCAVLSEPMKPMVFNANDTDVYCPNCGHTLSGGWPLSDADDYRKLCQCPKCGQSIDDTICEEAESVLERMKERDK